MISCFDVADYFLTLQDDDAGDSITNLKLQKLVYLAQGFHLALFNKLLYNEQIRAWLYGPAIPSLWKHYSNYGPTGISRPQPNEIANIDKDVAGLLDEIYDVYGQYSAWKLRDITHTHPPYKNTKRNGVITPQEMKKYFKTQLKE